MRQQPFGGSEVARVGKRGYQLWGGWRAGPRRTAQRPTNTMRKINFRVYDSRALRFK